MVGEYNPYIDSGSFNNVVSGNPYTLQQSLSDTELKRINNEFLLWNFYKGHQWKSRRIDGEPQITMNYCKAFVDKGVAFLMGKGFNILVKQDATDVTKPLLDEVWEDNNKSLLALDIGQSGGVTGNAWVKVAVELFDQAEQPDMNTLYPNGRIRIMVLPTFAVFPTWHVHDRDKMVKCVIMYPVTVDVPRLDGSVEKKSVWYREIITPTTIEEYYGDTLAERRENRLGRIPVVRIKNLPLSGESLGISDIQDIVPLQLELNRKATDISDIINYHAAPVTVIQGARASSLEKGAKKVWGGLPKDAKVFNLELQSDLDAAMGYLDMIKIGMFELSHMPEDAFGKKMNISNTSGVALHIKNQPLMEITRTKWATYGEGLAEVNKLILMFARMIEHPLLDIRAFDSLAAHVRFWTGVEFPNPLPKDELIQMQLIAQKVSLMLMSRTEAMAELGGTDIEERFNRILEESLRVQDMVYDARERANEAQQINVGAIVDAGDRVSEPEVG